MHRLELERVGRLGRVGFGQFGLLAGGDLAQGVSDRVSRPSRRPLIA
jgi:hypothetical protein